MKAPRSRRLLWPVVALGTVVGVSLGAGVTSVAAAAPAVTPAAGPNPIQHVIVILQENHSFDNVLGKLCAEVKSGQMTRPGKDARCDGATTGTTSTGQVVKLASATDYVPALGHSVEGQQRDIDAGKMDGFNGAPTCSTLAVCYSQYDPLAGPCSAGSCIPNLAALAEKYTISDRTFELYSSPSWAGHLVWATANQDGFQGDNPQNPTASDPQPKSIGSGWGCDSGRVERWGPSQESVPSCVPDPTGFLGPNWSSYTGPRAPYVKTIFDELSAKGLTWKIYGGAGAPSPGSTSSFTDSGWQWAICPTFVECLYTSQRNNLVSNTQLATDAANGQLPSYAIVTPLADESQHNNDDMSAGDNFIGSTVAGIEASREWSSTAIFIEYDDCGCFYDHVNPLQYNSQWGVRVPVVIVSPYAKLGYTDSKPTTFAGTLAFVEHTFGLAALDSATDGSAYDYRGAFCFDPQANGCTQAGAAPTPMVSQTPTPLTASQKAAQVESNKEDT